MRDIIVFVFMLLLLLLISCEDTTGINGDSGDIDTVRVAYYENEYTIYNHSDSIIRVIYSDSASVIYHNGKNSKLDTLNTIFDTVFIDTSAEWKYDTNSDTIYYEIDNYYGFEWARWERLDQFNDFYIYE